MGVSLIRTVILYICITIALRIMGKRQIGELEPTELVTTIMVSELAAIPMQDPGIPITAGIIPIVSLISLEVIASYIALKSLRFRRLLSGNPCIVIKNGKLDRKKLQDMRISVDEILQELRLNNIDSISDLKYGIIETNGQLSYILKERCKPTTAEMIEYQVKPTGLSLPVICDGKLLKTNLEKLEKTVDWIEKEVKNHKFSSIDEIFIMTLDEFDNVFIEGR